MGGLSNRPIPGWFKKSSFEIAAKRLQIDLIVNRLGVDENVGKNILGYIDCL